MVSIHKSQWYQFSHLILSMNTNKRVSQNVKQRQNVVKCIWKMLHILLNRKRFFCHFRKSYEECDKVFSATNSSH